MGQRETELCPTEEDGYRGKTKVGTTTQKTKGEELLKKKKKNSRQNNKKVKD